MLTDRQGSFGMLITDPAPHTNGSRQGSVEQEEADRASPVHPSYNPKLFSDGALYLDPDIIGKTIANGTFNRHPITLSQIVLSPIPNSLSSIKSHFEGINLVTF